MSETRISAKRQTARWDPDADVSVADAMDFWSFAAAAANVVMQLAWPGVGYGVVGEQGRLRQHSQAPVETTPDDVSVPRRRRIRHRS